MFIVRNQKVISVATATTRPSPSRPSKLWWLIGLVLLSISLVVQLPARWLVQKFAPNLPYIQQISGNLWQGQANWQLMPKPTTPLAGTVSWQWQPWHLLTGKLGMAIHIQTGATTLDGQAKFNQTGWQVNELTGKIAPDTVRQLLNWQFPDSPIMVNSLSLAQENNSFSLANGEMNWSGGELGYPSGGKTYRINMPNILGKISLDNPNNLNNKAANKTATASSPSQTSASTGQRVHLAMTNQQGQRLGDFYLGNDKMLDIELTQRLLKNMPDYKGQGVDDTVVVTLRQPIGSMAQ